MKAVLCWAWLCRAAVAINIPFRKNHTSRSTRHANAAVVNAATASFAFGNLNNNVYVAEVLVQGQNFTVQLDTGSSDFWVDSSLAPAGALQDAMPTGASATNCYLDTTCASGQILLADVTFGNFTIPGQAFIGSNATFGGSMSGLMGFGAPFASASTVAQSLANNVSLDGLPLPNNLLTMYPNVDNYITFQLSRSVSGDTAGGTFTIGEIADEWDAIQITQQLDVLLGDAWASGMDAFIVNGHRVNAASTILSGDPDQLLALFDTGTARAQAPPSVVDAIYRDLPGAEYDGCCQYTLPCDTKLNISIAIGTRTFPIHPIDAVIIPEQGEEPRADADASICISAFSYNVGNYVDVILGDTFLRNAYALFNYGNWTRADDGAPYMQLLSTTNASAAWAEFDGLNAARLAARKAKLAGPGGKTSGARRRRDARFSGADSIGLAMAFVGGSGVILALL